MKKKFNNPELEIVLFAKEDIIVTSNSGSLEEPYPGGDKDDEL